MEFTFTHGWCYLELVQGADSAVRVGNHWLNNCFLELVESVRSLLEGKETVACRWQHEFAGGSFVDLVRDPRGGVHIAVHRFYFGSEAGTDEQVWSAARGDCLFMAHLPLAEFARVVAAELRRVRVSFADPTGVIRDWRSMFPETEFHRIERLAARYGYEPKPVADGPGGGA